MFSTGRYSLARFGVVDFQAIVRRAGGLDRLQADEAADAVIDVDDEIAGREARHLGDEILRAARGAARPHQAVAENVLLADDGGVFGLEAALDAEHGERDRGLRAAPAPAATTPTGVRLASLWSASTWLMRSRAPSLHSATATRLPAACSASDVLAHRLEHIGVGLGALGGEIAPGARADLDHVGRLRHGEWRQPRQRRGIRAARAIHSSAR